MKYNPPFEAHGAPKGQGCVEKTNPHEEIGYTKEALSAPYKPDRVTSPTLGRETLGKIKETLQSTTAAGVSGRIR